MKIKKYSERGQALILIALAIVGLIGFTALAIDGSRVFSDRRHSQNASDTAVLAAALERVRRPDQDWKQVAKNRAADNGYSSADGITTVDVYFCNELPQTVDGYSMDCKALPAGADRSHYVYVHIKSVVDLLFARVIGWDKITNHTDAVARATIPVPTNIADGYGIWSTHEGCATPGDGDPFELGGSAHNEVIGAGILVNADCATDDSFVQNGNPRLNTTTGVCVAGSANYDPSEITSTTGSALTEDCPPLNPDDYQMPPEPICAGNGELRPLGNNKYLAIPGNFDTSGNGQFPDANGQVTVVLTKGVYCLHNGMNVNAGVTLTTDTDGEGDFDPGSEGVFIYLPGTENGDDITINGGATINLHAINTGMPSWFDDSWYNLLVYVNPDFETDLSFSGGSGSTYTGTILAPSAHVHLLGNNTSDAGTVTFDSQIISDTVRISGNTQFILMYNETNNTVTLTNPAVILIE